MDKAALGSSTLSVDIASVAGVAFVPVPDVVSVAVDAEEGAAVDVLEDARPLTV